MEPFDVRYLDVGDGHSLYVEQVGSPGGTPAVYLHGGPGSGCVASQRTLFPPDRFRAVLFDQRGAGRSRAAEKLAANTTGYLIADMEHIRTVLGIDRWLVVGGSWGATLGLAYAEAHPDRVTGLVLRAVFLGTRPELDWAFLEGPKTLRPEAYADFLAILPEAERADVLRAYWRRILDPDPAVHRPAAFAWHDYERILAELAPAATRLSPPAAASPLPRTPFFEAKYFSHNCYLRPNQIVDDLGRIASIQSILVQGRYDLLCPPRTSFALAAAWPAAEVRLVEASGHSLTDPGVRLAMAAAIAGFSG